MGTTDGEGGTWWVKYRQGQFTHTRPYLIEILPSKDILVSDVTCSIPLHRTFTPFTPGSTYPIFKKSVFRHDLNKSYLHYLFNPINEKNKIRIYYAFEHLKINKYMASIIINEVNRKRLIYMSYTSYSLYELHLLFQAI